MLHKEHIFVDFRDCKLFMAKGVKFSKSVEMGGSFFKCSKILGA